MKVRFKKYRFLLILGFILLPAISHGQGVGLPFLKIGIGARQAGMGGVFTGVADDVYALWWNPGGLGHIRMWQWSVAYNRWFTDVYQATLTFAKQFRIIGSRKTTLGLSCSYLGMPPWDATGGKEPLVSAGHLVAGVSLGQRLDWISRALAVGINAQVISSRFDTYKSQGVATDLGILFKPERFKLGRWGFGIFDYGIVTGGVSLLHLGTKMTFDSESSSLPKTWRAGASLRMGRQGGWSLLFASDIVGVQDRKWYVSTGTEIWWKEIVGARLGYTANREDLGDFSFGFGLRWDDVLNSLLGLPSRFGDAFEVAVADVGYGDVLQQTYRGALSHYTVSPEPFRLEEPQVKASQVMGESSEVILNWEKTSDPDPFDEVGYMIIIDKDKDRIERAIRWVEGDMKGFLGSLLKDSLLVCEKTAATTYTTSVMDRGVYYWAVVGYDLNQHAQLSKRGEEWVSQFVVATPDLMVREFRFDPTPWITTTPEQGNLTFVVANDGNAPSAGFRFIVNDIFVPEGTAENRVATRILEREISTMATGEDTTIQWSWSTSNSGLHIIEAVVDPDSSVLELNKGNNIRRESVVSVPKGVFVAPDSVEVVATGYDMTEIPLVPEVYFDSLSSEVKAIYTVEEGVVPPLLRTLSERLQENPDVMLQVLGSVDVMSGEGDPVLADQRAEEVKKQLVALGLSPSRIVVVKSHPRKILGNRTRPRDPHDAKWIMEQSRVVGFHAPQEDEFKIFRPYQIAVDTTLKDDIAFNVRIVSPGEIKSWSLKAQPKPIEVDGMYIVRGDSLWGVFQWNGTDQEGNLVPRNRWYRYHLVVNDTLGRSFETRSDSVYLRERMTIQRREMFGAAKFGQAEPVYKFYWDRLMDIAKELVQNPTMRVRFEGHACAIGPEGVNERLSNARARLFTHAFMERIKDAYPNHYKEVWQRIDSPVGFGEKDPLRLKIKGKGDVLIGDNNSPIGRYLNRRIMIFLFKEN